MAPDDGNPWLQRSGAGSQSLIERYQDIARLSRAMLAAAHRGDWDEVARLEASCRGLIEHLRRAAMTGALNGVEQQRRIELLREILRDDAQIRMRAEPWLTELEQLVALPRGRVPPD
jgi:flagellar protein FliT